MLEAFGIRIEVPAMRAAGRSPAALIVTLLAVLSLAAGCSPSSGPLGTPSTPAPTGNASVAPPSGDATPGAPEASGPAVTPSAAPATAPATASAATSPAVSPAAAPAASPTPDLSGTTIVRAYFVLGSAAGHSGLAPVLREIPATVGVAVAAMRQLLAGPDAREQSASPAMSTAVPAATRLLSLSIRNGVATVDVSGEFAVGYDAAAPDARYAQVVYTLTQFPTVSSVAFELDGQPAGAAAITRAALRDAFLPTIFVDHPAWGAAAGNPVTVSGVANVFEAQFRIQVKDASGRILVDQAAQAGCGTGCWGQFSTALAYTVASAQWGTLRVYDLSMKDGSAVDVTEYPVWLTPVG